MVTLLFVLNRIHRTITRLLKSRVKQAESSVLDLRAMGPLHVCVCGSRLFKVGCMFEDNEVSVWFVDAECALCNALVKVPTPVDDL